MISNPLPSKDLYELIQKVTIWNNKNYPHQFNLLDELHANENAHTRILVRLLQVPTLLRSFLEYIKEIFSEQVDFDIPENLFPNDISEFSNYIDAKIETSNFCIIIENKINNAADQDKQIERYVDSVKSLNKNIFVIYLTLDGNKVPTTNSIGKTKVPIIELNYNDHILTWLEHKITFSVADSLQQPFLQSGILQYIDHLKGKLGLRKNNYDELINSIKSYVTNKDVLDIIGEIQYIKSYWRIYFTRNIPNNWEILPNDLKTEILLDICGLYFAINRTTDNKACFLYESDTFSLEAVTASKISLIQIDVHYSGNKNGTDAYQDEIIKIKNNLHLPPYIIFEYNGADCLRVTINTPQDLQELFDVLSLQMNNFSFNFTNQAISKEIEDQILKNYNIINKLEDLLNNHCSDNQKEYQEEKIKLDNGSITGSYNYSNGRAIQLVQKTWERPYAIDIWSKDNESFIIDLIKSFNNNEMEKIYPYSCNWWNGKYYLHFPLLSLESDYTKDIAQKLYNIYLNGK